MAARGGKAAAGAASGRGAPPALGPRLHALRKARGLTLDALSEGSGISKSMLSQIERGQANPTFGTLWNITRSLGIEFAELVEGRNATRRLPPIERLSGPATPTIRSADGKCALRILSPGSTAGLMEWYEMTLDPGGLLESEPHNQGAVEHLTCLAGELQVRSAEAEQRLAAGDTVRYRGDVPHAIANPGRKAAKALLVVLTGGTR